MSLIIEFIQEEHSAISESEMVKICGFTLRSYFYL